MEEKILVLETGCSKDSNLFRIRKVRVVVAHSNNYFCLYLGPTGSIALTAFSETPPSFLGISVFWLFLTTAPVHFLIQQPTSHYSKRYKCDCDCDELRSLEMRRHLIPVYEKGDGR